MSTAARVTDPRRVITLDGAHNFRDLGGYATDDGRTTRWRTLYRADGLHRLTRQDLERVRPLGLRTVIDLRTQGEVDVRGRFPVDDHPIDYHHVPVMDVLWSEDQDRAPTDDPVEFLVAAYHGMLDTNGPRFALAFDTLARPDALPAVFHCTAGKDRTGLLAALLLAGVGVRVDEIVGDYGLTAAAMERTLAWARTRAPDIAARYAEIPAVYLAVPPRAMEHVLEDLAARHGSLGGFIEHIGVPHATLAALREALVGPP